MSVISQLKKKREGHIRSGNACAKVGRRADHGEYEGLQESSAVRMRGPSGR